jgi:hypothetical protein
MTATRRDNRRPHGAHAYLSETKRTHEMGRWPEGMAATKYRKTGWPPSIFQSWSVFCVRSCKVLSQPSPLGDRQN